MGRKIYVKRVEIENTGDFTLTQDATGTPTVLDPIYRPGPATHEGTWRFHVENDLTGQYLDGEWKDGQTEPTFKGGFKKAPGSAPANS